MEQQFQESNYASMTRSLWNRLQPWSARVRTRVLVATRPLVTVSNLVSERVRTWGLDWSGRLHGENALRGTAIGLCSLGSVIAWSDSRQLALTLLAFGAYIVANLMKKLSAKNTALLGSDLFAMITLGLCINWASSLATPDHSSAILQTLERIELRNDSDNLARERALYGVRERTATPEERRFLEQALPTVKPEERYRILVALDRFADADRVYSDAQLNVARDDATRRARLFVAKGDRHFYAREFEAAIEPYQEAVRIDPSNLLVVNRLALAIMGEGTQGYRAALDEAKELLERARTRLDMEANPDPLVRARVYNTLGVIYKYTQQPSRAVELLQVSLKIYREQPSGFEISLINTLNNSATALADAGRPMEALPLIREAVARQKVIPGAVEQDSICYMETLAGVLLQTSKVDLASGRSSDAREKLVEAASIYRYCMERRVENVGWPLQNLAEVKLNLAAVLKRLDQRDEARTLAKEGLEILRRLFPNAHASKAKALLMVAGLLDVERDASAAADAFRLYSEALDMSYKLFSGPNEIRASALNGQARSLYWMGDRDNACKTSRDAVKEAESLWGISDLRTKAIQDNSNVYCR